LTSKQNQGTTSEISLTNETPDRSHKLLIEKIKKIRDNFLVPQNLEFHQRNNRLKKDETTMGETHVSDIMEEDNNQPLQIR
jgi:hypothetical protein